MRIVTNGIFDCFHDGHKHILNRAAKWGKEIFILINTDESARELKGSKRPVDILKTRIDKIQGHTLKFGTLGPKWYTLPFHTEEELALIIDCLRPDMILKGNDRPDVREITGSDKWPVCILPRLKDKDGQDISTTRIINEDRGA
jgi:D-beta-D-heptose 7-phosphate kinase/D-beta-D-heptose 1-phosphate adenosyltransferase